MSSWTDLDWAYFDIFGEHPDLSQMPVSDDEQGRVGAPVATVPLPNTVSELSARRGQIGQIGKRER